MIIIILDNAYYILYMYIQPRIVFRHKNNGNLFICNNMNEPAGYHATRNKPQRETQILDAITPEWNMKTNKIKDHRSKRVGKWLPKAERVGK